jgi:hypothetical protein
VTATPIATETCRGTPTGIPADRSTDLAERRPRRRLCLLIRLSIRGFGVRVPGGAQLIKALNPFLDLVCRYVSCKGHCIGWDTQLPADLGGGEQPEPGQPEQRTCHRPGNAPSTRGLPSIVITWS